MLLYGWKIVCFVISLSGLLSSWIVLPFCPRLFLVSFWVPITYGIANTVLQVMFCIGLAWQMDPFQMPHAFCIAQSTLIQMAWTCLAGLCAATCCTTAAATSRISSLKPVFLITTSLPFRIFLIIVFPATIFSANIGLSLRLNAVQPQDSLNCDATQLLWVRLVGYAGTNLLLSVPSFVISCLTATRLTTIGSFRLPPRIPPPLHAVYTHSALTSLPTRRRQRTSEYSNNPPSIPLAADGKPCPIICPSSLQMHTPPLPEKPRRTRSGSKHSRNNSSFENHNHSQLSAPPSRSHSALSQITGRPRSRASTIQVQDRSRHTSYHGPPSPIIFNSPSRAESQYHTVLLHVSPAAQDTDADADNGDTENEKVKDDVSISFRPREIDLDELDDAVSGPLRWAKDSDRDSLDKTAYAYDCTVPEDEEPGLYTFPPNPALRRSGQAPPWMQDDDAEAGTMNTRLRYIVLFQLMCSSTLILAAISTLVDVFSGRSMPSRVGTQHVALLLMAWVPALLLGVVAMRRFLCGMVLR